MGKLRASVLINNYNYGRYLDHCIKSVLEQTYGDVEIIVYDDGSTDKSLSILEKYNEQITTIQKENYGQAPNINQMNAVHQAFLKSTGEVVFLLDSDDAFHHKKVEEVMKVFQINTEVDAIQHPMYEMDGDGHVKDVVRPVLKRVDDYKNYIQSTNSLFHLFVPTSGLAFKRSLLNELLPLEEDNLSTICVDIRLMLYSALIGTIKTIHEPLGYYRIHGTNVFKRIGNLKIHQQYESELYHFFNTISKEYGLKEVEFDTVSYLENTFFYPLLDKEKNIRFINNVDNDGECWIWGAGEAGQTVLHSLRDEAHRIEGFIDADPQKQHVTVMGKKVFAPEEIIYSGKLKVLVSPYHVYEVISSQLKSKGLIQDLNYISPYK